MGFKVKSKSKVVEDYKGNKSKEREFNFSTDTPMLIQLFKIFFKS